jgi:hypothetical protein
MAEEEENVVSVCSAGGLERNRLLSKEVLEEILEAFPVHAAGRVALKLIEKPKDEAFFLRRLL